CHFFDGVIVFDINGREPRRVNATVSVPWLLLCRLQNESCHFPFTGSNFPARSPMASRYEMISAFRPETGFKTTDLNPPLWDGRSPSATAISPSESFGIHHCVGRS